jgi:TolB protein
VQKIFQEGDKTYALIARPLMPHETPYRIGYYPGLPRDYVPVLNCEEQPALLSPAIPTATPTLTSPAARLTGQGRIVFVTGSYNEMEIYVSEVDGTNRLRLTNNQFADDEPVWSPDGQRIAFVSERSGNRDVFVMDADGRNVVQLTNDTADDYSPTWSPDGSMIAFISDRDGGWSNSEIFTMNADGSEKVRLTTTPGRKLLPVWSPDGHKIAFVTKGTSAEKLAVLYLESKTIEDLMSYTVQSVARPAWSPDSLVVVTAIDSDREEAKIRFINLESGDIELVLIQGLEFPASLDWSVNGNYILFSAREPNEGENAIHYSEDSTYRGNWNIYAFDVSSQEIIQITYTQQDELSPAWWP